MALYSIFQYIIFNQLNKVINFSASGLVFIRQRIQYDRAIYINIFTQRVILESIPSVDDRLGDIFFFLSHLLNEKGLIDLDILDR